MTNAVTRQEIEAALELLKNRRSTLDRRIEFLNRELEKAMRGEVTVTRSERAERYRKLAHMVLIEGATINQAAKALGTGTTYGRQMLHRYCKTANRQVYYTGLHRNVYADGSESDCEPLLDWLREHATDFFK